MLLTAGALFFVHSGTTGLVSIDASSQSIAMGQSFTTNTEVPVILPSIAAGVGVTVTGVDGCVHPVRATASTRIRMTPAQHNEKLCADFMVFAY